MMSKNLDANEIFFLIFPDGPIQDLVAAMKPETQFGVTN